MTRLKYLLEFDLTYGICRGQGAVLSQVRAGIIAGVRSKFAINHVISYFLFCMFTGNPLASITNLAGSESPEDHCLYVWRKFVM